LRLSSYPRYKPSGIEWFGDVPEHWISARVSGLFRFRSGGTPSTDTADYWDGEIPWVSAKDMKHLRVMDTEDHITAVAVSESATTMVPKGTVLLVTRSGILKHTLPVAVTERSVAINQDVKGLIPTPERINSLYFVYLVHGNQVPLLARWRQQGATVESLDFEALKASRVLLPTIAEQQLIVDFLDRETAKLDTLLEKKRALIEKLKEKRAALISRTVTRGLPPDAARAGGFDPHPRLKPSGVEWLGDVPEHWEVTRLKNVITGGLANGIFKTNEYFGSGTRLINVYDAYRKEFLVNEESLERVETTSAELNAYRAQHGDIFFVRSSLKVEGVGRAVCCLMPTEDMVFECHLVRARPRSEQITAVFLITFLNSCFGLHWLISQANTVTMATLGQTKIMDLPLLLPPVVEQRAIADYVERETAKIDRMVEKVEEAIARLQEYRTALITAAVTGKIDVRGVGERSESATANTESARMEV
jgi:type I restriction enzyme S subunit